MRWVAPGEELSSTDAASWRAPRIAVLTPNHLVANPRVIKEADALAEAGFDVHVISAQRAAGGTRDHDAALARDRLWSWTAVRSARTTGELVRFGAGVVRQTLCSRIPRALWDRGLFAERASGRVFPLLVREATRCGADLYIGHYPEGLVAAGIAASRTGALLGFDAEDFHTGEPNTIAELNRTDFLQARYLPRCEWITAASLGIARALAEKYGISEPQTIYNAFPLSERKSIDGARCDRLSDNLSLYWYSQTIGLDRGIQDVIRAAGQLGGPVEIHLRGELQADVRESLLKLGRECGVAHQLFFHATVSPSELLSRAAEHDVGLALEQPTTLNRAICTTNKLFFYLLAGLAVLATDVPGQASVLAEHPDAAALYKPGDVAALAAVLERWRVDRNELTAVKSAALKLAQERWNWEHESQKLVSRARTLLTAEAVRESEVQAGINV